MEEALQPLLKFWFTNNLDFDAGTLTHTYTLTHHKPNMKFSLIDEENVMKIVYFFVIIFFFRYTERLLLLLVQNLDSRRKEEEKVVNNNEFV